MYNERGITEIFRHRDWSQVSIYTTMLKAFGILSLKTITTSIQVCSSISSYSRIHDLRFCRKWYTLEVSNNFMFQDR